MKTLYKSALVALFSAVLFSSCDEDTVVFNGNDFVSFTNVAASEVSVTESAGTVNFPVRLTRTFNEDITVNFTITSDNATEGTDYRILTPTVVIPAGSYESNFSVAVVDDEEFNEPRSLKVVISSTSRSGLNIGIVQEGSHTKVISIVNDDCPTKFTYWLGTLSIEDVGEATFTGQGASNAAGDCDVLVVDGNLPGETASSTVTITNQKFSLFFTPDDETGETGSVDVPETAVGTRPSGATTYNTRYVASGTYDTTTGRIVLDYEFRAYTASGTLAGRFWTGQNIITLGQ